MCPKVCVRQKKLRGRSPLPLPRDRSYFMLQLSLDAQTAPINIHVLQNE
jgi:hypothetical protein